MYGLTAVLPFTVLKAPENISISLEIVRAKSKRKRLSFGGMFQYKRILRIWRIEADLLMKKTCCGGKDQMAQ